MNSWYENPKKLREELGRHKTDNFVQDLFTDWVSSGLSIGDDGKVKREGAAFWLQGFTPGAEKIAQKKEEIKEADAIKLEVDASGLDPKYIEEFLDGRQLTAANARALLGEARRNYQTPTQKAQERRTEETHQNYIKNQNDQLTLQRESMQNDNEWRKWQAAENSANRAADRLATVETNRMNLQLQYAQMAQTERMRAQDRKDKAIMTLISGLTNLGSAFTV